MSIIQKITLNAVISVAGDEQDIPLEVSYIRHPASRPTFIEGKPLNDGAPKHIEILNVRAPMLEMPERDKVSIMWALTPKILESIEQEIAA